MRNFALIFAVTLLSCNNVNKEIGNQSGIDSISRIDSLKWYYYASNYYGNAVFYDSVNDRKVKAMPIECDVELEHLEKINIDSSIYLFTLRKPKLKFQYIEESVYCVGFKIIKGEVHPIISHVIFDTRSKNKDSVAVYLKRDDQSFRNYLKQYSGGMSKWLREEATRRGIFK